MFLLSLLNDLLQEAGDFLHLHLQKAEVVIDHQKEVEEVTDVHDLHTVEDLVLQEDEDHLQEELIAEIIETTETIETIEITEIIVIIGTTEIIETIETAETIETKTETIKTPVTTGIIETIVIIETKTVGTIRTIEIVQGTTVIIKIVNEGKIKKAQKTTGIGKEEEIRTVPETIERIEAKKDPEVLLQLENKIRKIELHLQLQNHQKSTIVEEKVEVHLVLDLQVLKKLRKKRTEELEVKGIVKDTQKKMIPQKEEMKALK